MQINKAKHIGKWGKIYYCAFTRHLQVWTFLGRVLAEMLVSSTVPPDGQATVNILMCCIWFMIISNVLMPNIACIEPFMTYEGDEIAPETKKGSSNNWKMNPIECMKACQFHSRYVRGLRYFYEFYHFISIWSNLIYKNQLLTNLIAGVIFGSSSLVPSAANYWARMETQKGWKNFMHDLDNIWWTSISNYRWLSTKIRIAGPKYCKDTTYVGEMGFMIVSNWLYWLCHLQGVCFMAVDSYPKMK